MSTESSTKKTKRLRSAGLVAILLTLAGAVFFWQYDLLWVGKPEAMVLEKSGVVLHADLFQKKSDKPVAAAVLLLHSSNPLGRLMPYTRIMATRISDDLPVLNADLRGFGDSPLLVPIAGPADLDFADDIKDWVKVLQDRFGLPYEKIILIGRATGAASLIQYMANFPDRRHPFFLICPPRGGQLGQELFESDNPAIRKRWEHDMGGNTKIPIETIRAVAPAMRLENLPQVQQGRHIVLLDTPATMDTPALEKVFTELGEPKDLFLAKAGATHYFGTNNQCNDYLTGWRKDVPFLVYERAHFDPAWQFMQTFFRQQ